MTFTLAKNVLGFERGIWGGGWGGGGWGRKGGGGDAYRVLIGKPKVPSDNEKAWTGFL